MVSLVIACNSRALGGAEILSIRLAEALTQRGIPVALALPEDSPACARAAGAHIQTLPLEVGPKISFRNIFLTLLRAPWDYLAFRRFLKAHIVSQPGCPIVFQFKKEQFLGTLAAHRLGIRVHWIEHGPLPKGMCRWPWTALYRMASRRASQIIVVSSATQKSLERCGVPSEKIRVIYPGIPVSFFNSDGAASEGELVIGTVSRLLRNKCIDDFILAASLVCKRWPAAKFLIVGDGADRARLEQFARTHALTGIHFAGAQSPVEPWIRRMTVVVNSTAAEGEGMPLRILEAMACGRAVVSTDIGGCAEALGYGRYGRLVPPKRPDLLAAAIEDLLKHPDETAWLGKEAQAWCRQTFSQDAIAMQWMDALGLPVR